MQAIRVREFGEPSVLKLEEVPDPTPAADQVVVKLHAIGVNPVETYIRKGIYGPRQFPFTPGTDAAGVIEAVGAGVTSCKGGDRVYVSAAVSGTYAEKALCAASGVHRLPEGTTFEQGAALGVPYATAYRALWYRAKAQPGETVLIHGATGGVGVAAIQIARAIGMNVIGTGGTDRGREMIRKEGAHHALDHHDSGYLEQLMSLTHGNGVDLVLEMLANVNLANDLAVLARDGRVIVIGSRGNIEIDPRQTMKRDADIRGMTLFNASEGELRGIHAALIAGLENGTLRPIVGQVLPLAEAPRAHEEVMKPSGAFGKLVLKP